jgi:hypothetical protein
MDEFKGLLRDKPELAKSEPEILYQLLDDACYMISRMQRRREEYEKFVAEVAPLCKQVEAPKPEHAYKIADEIRAFLQNRPEDVPAKLEQLYELAEQVRDVGGKQEKCLSTYKNLAIKVGKLYREIKGRRNWEEDKKS